MKEKHKCIINIDKLVQYPIAFSRISHSLSENLGINTSIVPLVVFHHNPTDILVDDEYMKVINVGFGTQVLVLLPIVET